MLATILGHTEAFGLGLMVGGTLAYLIMAIMIIADGDDL